MVSFNCQEMEEVTLVRAEEAYFNAMYLIHSMKRVNIMTE